ncbi:hypothetical protein [Melghiribacillus thermohalophilus]|uniref:hypothetical protein n=1 Tax=Melghiribacillus thermohalophilus TaxID=1324956 RepID=UPI001404807B|nr:hypothetical protein [Melghiribacillus thermohalophilus]
MSGSVSSPMDSAAAHSTLAVSVLCSESSLLAGLPAIFRIFGASALPKNWLIREECGMI